MQILFENDDFIVTRDYAGDYEITNKHSKKTISVATNGYDFIVNCYDYYLVPFNEYGFTTGPKR